MKPLIFILTICLFTSIQQVVAQVDTTKKSKEKTQKELETILNGVNKAKPTLVEDEISNIIIDQTKTKSGKDFIDLFTNYLELPSSTVAYTIVIEEKPSLGRNSMISIIVNDIEIYSTNLQPREDKLQESSLEAAEVASEFITNYTAIMRDMSTKEQLGTGIF
jgi:hypothetical protein